MKCTPRGGGSAAPLLEPEYVLHVVQINDDILGVFVAQPERHAEALMAIAKANKAKLKEAALAGPRLDLGEGSLGAARLSSKGIIPFTAAQIAALDIPIDTLIEKAEAEAVWFPKINALMKEVVDGRAK